MRVPPYLEKRPSHGDACGVGGCGYECAAAVRGDAETASATVLNAGDPFVVRVCGVVDQGGSAPLTVVEDVIEVIVLAQDGETALTYPLVVARRRSHCP